MIQFLFITCFVPSVFGSQTIIAALPFMASIMAILFLADSSGIKFNASMLIGAVERSA